MLQMVTDPTLIAAVEAWRAKAAATDAGRIPTLEALQVLLANPAYHFEEVAGHNSNAAKTWNGFIPWANAQLELSLYFGFGAWFSINLAFGEVRHVWANHTPLGYGGMVGLSSIYNPVKPPANAPGCALPGFDFVGLGYRVGCYSPQGRTSSGRDGFVQPSDPIAYALTLRDEASCLRTHPADATAGLWSISTAGW